MRVADGLPVVFFGEQQQPLELERLSPDDPSLDEAQIQKLIGEHPAVLPIAELDETFAPAVPIGREIRTDVGPIDALYVSPSGGITIVEAKLWRNPQARREVVGQIIDYATALSSWSYEQLDAMCTQVTGQSLWDRVSEHADGATADEAGFIDAVARGLRHGRFLLLIVGDGIREDVERMTSYVQSAPQLQFHLALVELRMFVAAERGLRMVIPSVVARTAEVTRAVVRVDIAERASVEVDVAVPANDSPRARRVLTLDTFMAELRDRASEEEARFVKETLEVFSADPRFHLVPRAASMVLRLRPQQGGDLTVLVFEVGGKVYPGWLSGQLKRVGLPKEVAFRFVADLGDIVGIAVHDKYADSLATSPDVSTIREHWPAINDRIEQLADEVDEMLA